MATEETMEKGSGLVQVPTTIDALDAVRVYIEAQIENSCREVAEAVEKAIQAAADHLAAVTTKGNERLEATKALALARMEQKVMPSSVTSVDLSALEQRVEETDAALRALVPDFPRFGAQKPASLPIKEVSRPAEAPPVPEPRRESQPSPAPRMSTDPALAALWSEFNAIDLDRLSPEVFGWWAEELACEARALQDQKVADPEDLVTRMIGKLTAKVRDGKSSRKVYGLARGHHGDWKAFAEYARGQRKKSQGRQ